MDDRGTADKVITAKEAAEQVQLIAGRLAMFYHYTAEVLVDDFGEERGQELLREIIRRYGREIGTAARAKVSALGLPATADNFNKGSDLPKWGWEGDLLVCEDGVERTRITHCPLAGIWKKKGSEKVGRLYCLVDEFKFDAYNGARCRHLKNVLDGDDCCLIDVEETAGLEK